VFIKFVFITGGPTTSGFVGVIERCFFVVIRENEICTRAIGIPSIMVLFCSKNEFLVVSLTEIVFYIVPIAS
jgi:hypothetical protein